MKRLNLLYKPRKAKGFPWLLIHPKVKNGLARFETRADAINWFLQFNYESYIWFQTEEKIFGGQIATLLDDSLDVDDKKLLFIPKVTGFDGGDTYEGICKEFMIHEQYLSRSVSEKVLKETVKKINAEIISDIETYFPEEFESKRKKTTEYIDLSSIKASLELRIRELEKNENIAKEKINLLKEELAKKEADFISINKNIDDYFIASNGNDAYPERNMKTEEENSSMFDKNNDLDENGTNYSQENENNDMGNEFLDQNIPFEDYSQNYYNDGNMIKAANNQDENQLALYQDPEYGLVAYEDSSILDLYYENGYGYNLDIERRDKIVNLINRIFIWTLLVIFAIISVVMLLMILDYFCIVDIY
ncbi:MAG3090 family protein [Mycoplasma sp. Mirounga ES2805-ORL]|uniref:MAG3090 family protein n=1 Tax=Mycoplasma sp. Mirounga ES2805-ORL TaxID=754514 RepID=UPI00197C2E74|nr:hypothetical protein [Mycoplasma sp. Mirounga ES2805-ORL]QSF13761.1 hypothetical protein JXZ90_00460 [Mycoplasma sp. Mirounga ES2805-ORL]